MAKARLKAGFDSGVTWTQKRIHKLKKIQSQTKNEHRAWKNKNSKPSFDCLRKSVGPGPRAQKNPHSILRLKNIWHDSLVEMYSFDCAIIHLAQMAATAKNIPPYVGVASFEIASHWVDSTTGRLQMLPKDPKEGNSCELNPLALTAISICKHGWAVSETLPYIPASSLPISQSCFWNHQSILIWNYLLVPLRV